MSEPNPASPLANLTREQRALLFERLRQRKERAEGPEPERIPRRPPDLKPIPLSFAQERLWFIDRLEPGITAYNMPMALRVVGEASPALLAALLGEIARRHEVLRTTFRVVAGKQVAQVVAPPAPWHLPLVDLSALPAARREREAGRLADEEAARPFHLARGPLLRATLLRLAPAEQALLLNMHHIVSDGWSMGVLVREITELYAAAVAGAPSPLPELAIQYADFAVWQRGWLTGEVLERQLAYWRERLAGAPAVLDLPADRPLPAARTHAGEHFVVSLAGGLRSEVAQLARRHEATPFMVLLAAFQALLGRLTGAEDLNVGSPIANRNRAEIEPLIGFFVNTLVLRGDLAGDPPFDELIGRARAATLGAYAHQDLPFERLVEELRPERQLAVSPLFQVLFSLQNAPMGTIDLPGLSLSTLPFDSHTAQFDLDVNVWERDEELIFQVGYSTERFDPATPRRWMAHLETLLRGLVADPGRPVSRAPLLSPAERWQLAGEWNDTALPLPLGRCLHELVAAQAARTPDAPAVVAEDGELTYGELAGRAERLARRLRRLGVGPEVPVGLFAERSAALVVAVLGVLEAGGAYVPLDPGYPSGRLAAMLEDTAAPVLLTTSALAGQLPPHRARVLLLDDEEEKETDSGEEAPALRPTADNLAAVIFTSGSTGRPKGVMLPHRGLVNRLLWAQHAYRLGPADAVLLKAAFGFDFAIWELFAPLLAGARLVVARPGGHVDPAYLARAIRAHGVTLVHFVPSMLDVFLSEEGTPALPSLRQVFAGGEALSPALRERFLARFPGVPLDNQYGPTEISIDTTRWVCAPGQDPLRVSLGRPIGNTRVHLLDRAGSPVPAGAAGVLHVGGAGVARGYLGRPDLTAERFVPDPFADAPGERLYDTGDLARRLPDGNLEFLGRADSQVKVRGVRVEPGEVETALLRHPAVAAAAVGADADGTRLAAWVVLRPDAGAAPAALRDFLRDWLPEAMLPSLFVPLEALPQTPSGKLDRRSLPAPEAAARQTLAPSTPAERVLAGIWSDLLGVEAVGAQDDFFDLGGHSLLATRLVSRVRQTFGVELALRAVFEAPTLAVFAARVDRERGGGTVVPPVLPVPRDRPLPLSFSQERLWFLYLLAPESPVYNMSAAMRLAGRLDVAALAAALSEVLRRHEALRTTFRTTAAGAVQEIHPWAPQPQPLIDLAALPQAARQREARRIARQEGVRPFDLEHGPLLRTLLLRLEAGEHVALWSTHHVAADGWSLSEVFVPELTRLYAAAVEGLPSPLPEPPVQYADYAVWQRDWLRGEVLAEQLGHWRRELDGLPPLDLPADRPRPPVPSGRGGAVLWDLPPTRTAALARLARAGDATLFMALFAAFAAALHRETGAAALPVGLPVANRSRGEIEGLIGFFVNTLVLRGDLSGDPDFPALLGRARATVLGALSHQDLPFERLVDELRLPRDPYRPPLLRVTFQLQTASDQGDLELPGVTLTPFAGGDEAAKFDLVVNLFETGEGVSGVFLYDADLFDAATAARLAGHFGVLLDAWIAEPARRLADLPLLAPTERHQLLVEWNPAAVPEEGGRLCLHRQLEAQVDRAPEAMALSMEGERLTYAELDARANRIARHLQASGVRPGDRVALLLERSAGMVAAILGVLKAGAAYVPIDPTSPAERIAFLREDSGAALLIGAGDLEAAGSQDGSRLDVPVAPDFPAYVIYTSGSTGRPKGVVVTHANVGRLFTATDPWFDFGPEDVWTLFHSYAFDFSVWEIWGALLYGGRLVVVPYWVSRSPEAFFDLLAAERVTVLNQTPSAFRQLLWASEGKPADLALRYVVFGGEALEPASLAPWIARYGDRPRLINMYGITETTVHVTYRPVGEGDLTAGSRIGVPIPDLAVHLLDGALQPVPIGVPGEIHVGGAGLAQGYLGRPELTAERFVPDPFSGSPGARLYRSGDLARRLSDGDLEYLGRADQQVKIRGFRIELGEIEAALAGQPGVREAVVLAREDAPGDRRLVAYVAGGASDPAVLRQALAERLPDYMIPAAFVFLEALPLTGNGKIDRKALPAPEAAAAPAAELREARDPLEAWLLGQFRDALGLPAGREIGIDDDFFALGGTSITSAIFAHRLQEALRETFHVVAIFDHPTVAALADHLRERHPEGARRITGEEGAPAAQGSFERSILVPIQEGAPGRRPLFCVHSVGGEVVAYRPLARHLGPEQPVWGLQSPDPPLESIPEMAEHYLAAVRSLQPAGPYRIAGWSMGGAVAYEMARQLEAAGETTEVLAMIDAVSAASWFGEQQWSDTEMLGLFAVAMVYLHDVDIPADLDLPQALGVPPGFDLSTLDVSGLSLDDALAAALDLGRQVGLLPPGLAPEELRRIFERFRANRVSLSFYQPETYGGDLHLFRARGQAGMGDDPTLGWSRLVTGQIHIFDCPGDHYTILREEVEGLAVQLRELLGR
ncbi:MAG TPA: amino acid adenylation domain-containing protein [Thermoanaerobaculia bacterium]